jgi:hypothetical protein
MGALLPVARRYVITDAGWNLLSFAARARNLAGGSLAFRTLPIKGYAAIGGQDANVVSPASIRPSCTPRSPRRPRPAPSARGPSGQGSGPGAQRPAEETSGRRQVTSGGQQHVNDLAVLVDGPV